MNMFVQCEKATGIDLELTVIPESDYSSKLNQMVSTGDDSIDIYIIWENDIKNFAQANGIIPMDDYLANSTIKTDEFIDAVAKLSDGLGGTYGLPWCAATEILYYNKDMFDKAGVAYPPADAKNAWTWDEFVHNAKLLTLDANGNNATSQAFNPNAIVQYGAMIENLTWQLEVWALSNGGGFYTADGSKVIINESAATDAIQKVADLHLVHHVAPLSTGLTDDGIQRSLIAGTCAMSTNGAWNVGTSLASARAEGLNYGVAVLPYMKEKVTSSWW